jgi:hypothetical protein
MMKYVRWNKATALMVSKVDQTAVLLLTDILIVHSRSRPYNV